MKRKLYLGYLCAYALGLSGLASSCATAQHPDMSQTLEALAHQDPQYDSEGRLRLYPVIQQDGVRGGLLTVRRDWMTGRHVKSLDVPMVQVYTLRDRVSERKNEFDVRFIIQIPKRLTKPDWMITVTPMLDNQGKLSFLRPVCITGEIYEKYNQRIIASERRRRQRDVRFNEALQERSEFFYDKEKKMWMTAASRDSLHALDRTRKLDRMVLARDAQGEEVWEYHYSQTLQAAEFAHDFRIFFNAQVENVGCRRFTLSASDTLSFRITSLADFCDPTVRFHPEGFRPTIHEEFTAQLHFRQGQSALDMDVASNRKAVERLKERIRLLRERNHMSLDKVSITASCSPEGTVGFNSRLGLDRAENVLRLLRGPFPDLVFESESRNENWEGLKDLVSSSDSIVNRDAILAVIRETEDWDQREALIRSRYPEDYERMVSLFYPHLREVRIMGYFSRTGESAGSGWNDVDERYMQGVDLLIHRRYDEAMELLEPYADWNAAVCHLCLGEDLKARAILGSLPESARQQYLLAIVAYRLQEDGQAKSFLERSYQLDETGFLRARYDMEIDSLTHYPNH